MYRLLIPLILLQLAFPCLLEAQEESRQASGTQQDSTPPIPTDSLALLLRSPEPLLRIGRPDGGFMVGHLQNIRGDSVVLSDEHGELRTIPLRTSISIEERLPASRWLGMRNRGMAGLLLGSAIGIVYAVVEDSGGFCSPVSGSCPAGVPEGEDSVRDKIVSGVIIGGSAGAVLGAVLGFIEPGEVWREVRR